jgi:ankyrin repeat protein
MFASPDVMSLLLKHGAKVEHRSALNKATYTDRLDIIRLLLDEGVAIDEISDNENINDHFREKGMGTALHDAAKAGKADVVQLLLERRANKLIRDTAGQTAREVAVKEGHDECAKLLE